MTKQITVTQAELNHIIEMGLRIKFNIQANEAFEVFVAEKAVEIVSEETSVEEIQTPVVEEIVAPEAPQQPAMTRASEIINPTVEGIEFVIIEELKNKPMPQAELIKTLSPYIQKFSEETVKNVYLNLINKGAIIMNPLTTIVSVHVYGECSSVTGSNPQTPTPFVIVKTSAEPKKAVTPKKKKKEPETPKLVLTDTEKGEFIDADGDLTLEKEVILKAYARQGIEPSEQHKKFYSL